MYSYHYACIRILRADVDLEIDFCCRDQKTLKCSNRAECVGI